MALLLHSLLHNWNNSKLYNYLQQTLWNSQLYTFHRLDFRGLKWIKQILRSDFENILVPA